MGDITGRSEDERVIFSAIEEINGVFSITKSHKEHARQIVSEGTDAEVHAIADALRSDPDNFKGSLLMEMFNEKNLDITATVAAVYAPDINSGRSRHFRAQSFKNAYIRYVAADEVVFPSLDREATADSDDVWTISNENEQVRDRAKRFVAMTCAIDSFKPRASFELRDDLEHLMLDDAREDHDRIIEFLRKNKDGNVTLAQFEFFLNGGSAAVVSGAL